MFNNLKYLKKYKKLSAILLIVLSLTFLIPSKTHAIFHSELIEIITHPFDSIINGLIGAVGYFMSVLVTLASFLVNYTLGLNTSLSANGVITIGWRITRDLANLGFVATIIIIGFATILRFQGYGYKQLLSKLIIAAILVNFSLMIGFLFIDVSNVLADSFLKPITGGNYFQTANVLMSAFKPQALYQTTATSTIGGTDIISNKPVEAPLIKFASLVSIIVFSFILFVTLLAMAVMLLVRYIALALLLILMPLAVLFWILPITAGLWNKWWGKFIQWVFFLPAMSFFIYLAVVMLSTPAIYTATVTDLSAKAAAGIPNGTNISGFFAQMSRLILGCGILMGGLITAHSLSITGSKAALGLTQEGLKEGLKWTERKTVRTAGWIANKSERMKNWAQDTPATGRFSGIRNKMSFATKPIGVAMYKTQTKLSGTPGFKQLGQAFRAPGEHKSFKDSIIGGMKKGSGLFKQKSNIKDWEDANGHIVRATKRPTNSCQICRDNKWREVNEEAPNQKPEEKTTGGATSGII